MKKIIILILLISSFAYSQVDTANYNFQMSQLDGKFYSLISKNEVFGSAGFRYQTEILQTSSIDTTQFQYVPELSFGYYSMIENVASYYGKDSGLVRMMLYSNPNSTSLDTSTIPFLSQNNTFTGLQSFDSISANVITSDLLVFTGLSTTGAYNFIGNLYSNDSLIATRNWVTNNLPANTDTSLLVHKNSYAQEINATAGDFALFASQDVSIIADNGNVSINAIGNAVELGAITISLSAGTTMMANDGTGTLYWLRPLGTPAGIGAINILDYGVFDLTTSNGTVYEVLGRIKP